MPLPRQSTRPHGEEVCAACSRCWQRQSAYLCSRAESQRPPSLSLRRPSSTLGPSTDRAASAASPGRALHLARFRRVTRTQPTDSTTRRSSPTMSLPWRASWVRQSIVAYVERYVRPVSSSTRRIPQGSQYRSARTRVNKVFIAEFAFMSKTPAYQPGLFLSVSPDSGEGSRMSWVGLEDTPEGIRVTAADTPEVDGEFVDYDLALLRTVRFHTRSGSGSRSTAARTTTWCESPSTIVTSVSASRRGRTTTAPLRSRRRRRTSIRRRTSTACSSAPACRGPLTSPPVVATCSTT